MSEFLVFMEQRQKDRSQAFLGKKNMGNRSASVTAEGYCFPGTGYFTDTVFQIKRNPDLKMCVVPDSQVHHATCEGHSQVDEQPQVCDEKAKKIPTWGLSVDYSELRVSLISILVILK